MTKIAVLHDYQHVAQSMADWSVIRKRAEVEILHDAYRDEDHAAEALQDFDVLCVMRERLPMTASMFAKLPNLRCVVTTGEFNRAIDLDAATKHGVLVSGTTNAIGRLVTAELAWGLLLASARHIVREDRDARAGGWQSTIGTTLHGKTLGIVGLGSIGRIMARYARAFGMNILAWSRNLTDEAALESQARRVTKDELLAASDFVTLHMVLSSETIDLIDARALSLMKSTAVIINTSRGSMINEVALVDALRKGRIGGAALDTFAVEPLAANHPYRDFPDRLIISPHTGYVTEEVYRRFYQETVNSLIGYLDGDPIRVLNQAILTGA